MDNSQIIHRNKRLNNKDSMNNSEELILRNLSNHRLSFLIENDPTNLDDISEQNSDQELNRPKPSKLSGAGLTAAEHRIYEDSDTASNKWMKNSLYFIRRQTLLEFEKRRKSWKRLKSSEWSTWGKWLFVLGLITTFWCIGSLVWKLAYIDFYLYQMREDKQFIKNDLQRMLQTERAGRNVEINYEPIIRRTCTTENFKFIISLIVCCIASAFGFLLICCGLAGITVEVEENLEEELMDYLKSVCSKEPGDLSAPIYSSNQTLYDGHREDPEPKSDQDVRDLRNIQSCPDKILNKNSCHILNKNAKSQPDISRTSAIYKDGKSLKGNEVLPLIRMNKAESGKSQYFDALQ
ncbi:unnamed protein product [Gordionus sp. m RMFG-2023]|uniref:uncharacterized protein LOC135928266 n=1 Tax=Gordionus sp. m RMFG-2023 TaxID=3053472 RepID=UPI0030E2938A